jgi:hypothetical protein
VQEKYGWRIALFAISHPLARRLLQRGDVRDGVFLLTASRAT